MGNLVFKMWKECEEVSCTLRPSGGCSFLARCLFMRWWAFLGGTRYKYLALSVEKENIVGTMSSFVRGKIGNNFFLREITINCSPWTVSLKISGRRCSCSEKSECQLRGTWIHLYSQRNHSVRQDIGTQIKQVSKLYRLFSGNCLSRTGYGQE